MGPVPAREVAQLDEVIERLDPEETQFSDSGSQGLFLDTSLLLSFVSLGDSGYGSIYQPQRTDPNTHAVESFLSTLDDEFGEDAVISAIESYYGESITNDGTESDSSESEPGNIAPPNSWGYVQMVAFSFVTASYVLDDYLARNDLRDAVSEAKRRSWLLLLVLALMRQFL